MSLRSLVDIHTETGIIENTHEDALIKWKILDFSKVAKTKTPRICYDSPDCYINGIKCHFELFPVSTLDSKYMRLFIKTYMEREYSLEYDLSLEKSDGSAQQLANGILEGNNTRCDVGNLIKMEKLLLRKLELVPKNVLTMLCKFKRVTGCSTKRTASDSTMPLKFIRLDKLSENFQDLFGDHGTCDTTLKVQNKEYKAHRSVLIARSSVFAAAFKYDTLERQTGVITITDCDPDSFAVFLEYVYSGKIEELSACSALNLYYICDKYDVQEPKTFCVDYLMEHLTVENICEIAVFADKYEEAALFTAVQSFFNENTSKIFATSEWLNMMKKESDLANKLLLEMSKVTRKGSFEETTAIVDYSHIGTEEIFTTVEVIYLNENDT